MVIFTSHYFDRLSKLLLIVEMILFVIGPAAFAIEALWGLDALEQAWSVPLLMCFAVLVFIFVLYPLHCRTVDVLATRLFVRSKFKLGCSWAEARALRVLFHLDYGRYIKGSFNAHVRWNKAGRGAQGAAAKKDFFAHFPGWYPMDEVLDLPPERRLLALLRAADVLSRQQGST